MFQSNYDRLGRGFWEHAALAYLVGDDFGRMLGYRTDHPGSAPKLHTVTLRKTLGLGDGLFIVGAHQRFVSIEVTVIAYTVSAVIRHQERHTLTYRGRPWPAFQLFRLVRADIGRSSLHL